MRQHSVPYTLLFSAAVCGVCAILVSSSAVTLAERQDINKLLDKKRNVLEAAGLVSPDDTVAPAEIEERFNSFRAVVIDLETGEEAPDLDGSIFDQQKAKKDPATSHEAPDNRARVSRVPNHALVYESTDAAGELKMVVLPIEGYGLWSTLYGFIALEENGNDIFGLQFYEHAETPGLGAEVDNPRWKALWPGRKVLDDSYQPKIEVIKGSAGPVAEDPHRVDGLSGATITSRGVGNMLMFWLGPEGFAPYLERIRKGAA